MATCRSRRKSRRSRENRENGDRHLISAECERRRRGEGVLRAASGSEARKCRGASGGASLIRFPERLSEFAIQGILVVPAKNRVRLELFGTFPFTVRVTDGLRGGPGPQGTATRGLGIPGTRYGILDVGLADAQHDGMVGTARVTAAGLLDRALNGAVAH